MKRTTTIFRSTHARTLVVARLRALADRGAVFLAMLLVCLGAALSAKAQNPIGVLIADFNHDGIPDVMTPAGQAGNLTISFGAAPYGTFNGAATQVPYPQACKSVIQGAVAVGDFNNDGIPDVALSCLGAPSSIFVMLGHGDGTFVSSGVLPGLSNIVVGDFNRDGKLDIVAQGQSGSSQVIYFYAGNGDGTFAAAVTTTLASFHFYTSVKAVDVNNDGYPDLAMGNFVAQSNNTVDIFANLQNGTFGAPGPAGTVPNVSIAVGAYPASNDTTILTGNFFGTGLTDIAVVDTGSGNPGVFVAQNTSSGNTYSFAIAAKTAVPGLTGAAAANFVSAFTDLLVANGTSLSVLANSGKGTFGSTYANLTVAGASTAFAAADANGDGHADIYTATPTPTGATLTVNLLSGSATATSAPFGLPAGTAALTATWPGNIDFSGSTATGSQIVNALASVTGLSSSLNPAFSGQAITFTANVGPVISVPNVPTGMVTFMDGQTTLGSVTLSGGIATLTTSALTAGTHTITASYSGDSIFAVSSNTLSQVVNSNVPVITWSNPAAIVYGTALSATQLNATAANTQGTAIPGTFAYTPASGTVLNAGTQSLSVTFTPMNLQLYTVATKTVSILVNPATATINWTPALASIVYGTPLGAQQLNATATGVGGVAVSGTFVYTPASGTVLGAGAQSLSVAFTSTNANYIGTTGTARITVTTATPTLAWSAPASIAYGIPLSATQLNATAAGIGGVTLPGTFVYTPAAGTVLAPGAQTLSVTFTPADLVDYVTATTTVSLTITDIALTSFTPNTATVGDPNKTITITGSGFVANTVAQVNGTAVATTLVNPTTLTAVIPSANFTTAATLTLTLKNPTTGSTSNGLPLVVSIPAVTATYVGPTTTTAGTQPALNLTIPSYPIALTATLTINTKSLLPSGVTDPNVLFANGLTTYSFTIPANTTTIPPIQLQAGTVAETITVPLVLTANGVNVTPAGLAPVIITVPTAVPVATTATLTRSGNQLTVTVDGFSNTREIVQANFTFTPVPGATLTTTSITAPVATAFATYFATAGSLTAGSSFVYTQVFNIDGDPNSIASVQVTLTNTIGVSVAAIAQ